MHTRLLNISEAATIAIHAMVYIARQNGKKTSAKQISAFYGMSVHHLSKVLRKLVVSDLLSVSKGPTGGFYFTDEQLKTSFMDIFRAIEGNVSLDACLFATTNCPKDMCMFCDLVVNVNNEFEKYFNKTQLRHFVKKPKKSA